MLLDCFWRLLKRRCTVDYEESTSSHDAIFCSFQAHKPINIATTSRAWVFRGTRRREPYIRHPKPHWGPHRPLLSYGLVYHGLARLATKQCTGPMIHSPSSCLFRGNLVEESRSMTQLFTMDLYFSWPIGKRIFISESIARSRVSRS